MSKKLFLPLIILSVMVIFFSGIVPAETKSNRIRLRDDGLTLAVTGITANKGKAASYQYVSLLVKTGAGHDPAQKPGLTQLTNELVYLLFRESSALDVDYLTAPDFSLFQFTVANADLDRFAAELDSIIRLDALMLYDACNEIVLIHRNEPVVPSLSSGIKMAELIYGSDHPYTRIFKPDFKNLNINDVNAWFRKIYRPNNLIISSSKPLPEEFLRRPAGRDLKSPAGLGKIPAPNGRISTRVVFKPIRDSVSTIRIGFPAVAIGNPEFFAGVLSEKYLEKELWDRLREDAGLCYDVSLDYSFLANVAAPDLEIVFQTLPSETATAVKKALQILKDFAVDGIPADRLPEIIAHEKKRREARDVSSRNLVATLAFQALTGQSWLTDSPEYIERLNQVAQSAPPSFISKRLPQIRVSIAGPAEVAEFIPSITSEMNHLTKKEAASPGQK